MAEASSFYLLCECPDNITLDDLSRLGRDHDGGHGDTGITMTAAALTRARSSASAPALVPTTAAVQLTLRDREAFHWADKLWGLGPRLESVTMSHM